MPQIPRVIFVFFFNSTHEQCKSTVVQTVAQHSAVYHKITLSYHARRVRKSCMQVITLCVQLHALGTHSVATPPIQLGPVTTPKDYVATPNEPTLSRQGETLSRQTSVSHRGAAVATQNQLTMQHHYRDTKIVSRHQKTQLSRTLSRH